VYDNEPFYFTFTLTVKKRKSFLISQYCGPIKSKVQQVATFGKKRLFVLNMEKVISDKVID